MTCEMQDQLISTTRGQTTNRHSDWLAKTNRTDAGIRSNCVSRRRGAPPSLLSKVSSFCHHLGEAGYCMGRTRQETDGGRECCRLFLPLASSHDQCRQIMTTFTYQPGGCLSGDNPIVLNSRSGIWGHDLAVDMRDRLKGCSLSFCVLCGELWCNNFIVRESYRVCTYYGRRMNTFNVDYTGVGSRRGKLAQRLCRTSHSKTTEPELGVEVGQSWSHGIIQ